MKRWRFIVLFFEVMLCISMTLMSGSVSAQDNAPNEASQDSARRRPPRRPPMAPGHLASSPRSPAPAACFDKDGSRDFKPGITGGLKKEGIRHTIHQHAAEIEACYTAERAKNPELQGMVGVHWLLARDGKVTKVFIKESTLHNEAVETCLANAIATWTFPRGQNSGIGQVKHWFVFKDGKYEK